MNAISSYHDNSPTHPHTNTHTHKPLQYTAPQLEHSVTITRLKNKHYSLHLQAALEVSQSVHLYTTDLL